MDNNTNVPEVRRGDGSDRPVRNLTRIDPQTWPKDRLLWIWNQLLTQDYAFDDLALAVGPAAFLGQLLSHMSEWYEIGDEGLAAATGIIPHCNAIIHFAVWGDIETRELFNLQKAFCDDLFVRYEFNRLTAYIPAFNKQAIRMATIAGFRYEGELRKSFLKNGTFHNTHIYGILRDEFYKREIKH